MVLNSDKKSYSADSKPYRRFKNTWDVIKHRRRTFAILCVFGITNSALSIIFYRNAFPFEIINFILLILFAILSLGFLRSVYLHDIVEQSISSLFRLGKHFFWRQTGAYLLLILFLGAILLPVIIIFEIYDIKNYGTWLKPANFFAYALSIKFWIFFPMLIIVLDCSIGDAFRHMKYISLSNAPHLVAFSLGNSFIWHLNWFFLPRTGHYSLANNATTLIVSIISTIAIIIINVETIQVIKSTSKIGQIDSY